MDLLCKMKALEEKGIQLIHGNMLGKAMYEAEESVHCIIADLPYGVTACPWDDVIPFDAMWSLFFLLLQDRRAILLHASNPFLSDLIQSNKAAYCYDYYWNKRFAGNYVQAKRMPMRTIEPIGVFAKDLANPGKARTPLYFPQMIQRDKPIHKGGNKKPEAIPIRGKAVEEFTKTKKQYDVKFPTNYLDYSVRKDRGFHPTSKPVELYVDLIKTFTQEGETVFDPCMGAGPIGLACIRTGRKYFGIELQEKYFQMAVERMYEESLVLGPSALKTPTLPFEL